MSLTLCPVCSAISKEFVNNTPYRICPNCDAWFQDPAPPKVYHGAHETWRDQPMPENERAANESLADQLFREQMGSKPGPTLDIGADYPILASRFNARGCKALAIDGEPHTNDLDVASAVLDLERQEFPKVLAADGFALITCIHVFEHFYRPVDALRKLRQLVAEDGRIFIRSPDHCVPGYERDLTPGHYTIHPFYHSLTSILECCAQAGDCFEVERYDQMQPGQMNVILRPINKRPRLGIGMIVKNEERDLPRALASVKSIADTITVVDTGSTDRTMEIAKAAGAKRVKKYLGASEKDESGDWKLWDFSLARNVAIERTENAGDAPDWYFWLDADDVVITPSAIRRALYWPQFDCFAVWIDGSGTKWIQHRLWKLNKKVRFIGRCHEYPVLDGLNCTEIRDSLIVHHADPHPGEGSNERNLRMLLREWDETPSPRCAFYIANTHRDAGRHKEAHYWYQKRILMGEGFRDEWLFSMLYASRSCRSDTEYSDALAWAYKGIKVAPTWAEFRMELAHCRYVQKQYTEAIEAATACLTMKPEPTVLWREQNAYTDQPARLISWCHEHLGNLGMALTWAEEAQLRIGGPDVQWDQRVNLLRGKVAAEKIGPPAIVKGLRQRIALHRPGAIGDILMTLNLIPAFKEANPDADIHYFCAGSLASPEQLGSIILQSGVDMVQHSEQLESWRKQYDRVIDLVGYPLAESYPEKPMRWHLLRYFARELGLPVETREWDVALPSLTLARPPRPRSHWSVPERYVTIQSKAGWSSWKELPIERWERIVAALPDIPFMQVGLAGSPRIKGTNDLFVGCSLSDSISAVANAAMHVGIDSWANHVTNFIWTDANGDEYRTRAVIVWGSTQPSAAGYPSNVNLCRQPPCGPCFKEDAKISRMPRGICVTPDLPDRKYGDGLQQCMANITDDEIIAAIQTMWEQTK